MDREQIELIEQESNALAQSFEALGQKLFSRSISLEEFERSLLSMLKTSTIRAYVIGANATPTARHYGSAGLHLRQRYADIHKFAGKIAASELSEAQILDRLRRQAKTVRTAASRSEKITSALQGFDLAMRSLDPQAEHCPSCILYQTNGFIQIQDVVPRGVNCECGSNCRCRIAYKKSGNSLNPLGLVDIINKADRLQSLSENEILEKIERILTGRRRTRFARNVNRRTLGFGNSG